MSAHDTPRLEKLGNSPFWAMLVGVSGAYLLFICALLWATASYSTPGNLFQALQTKEIRYSIFLSLLTCSVSALISLFIAVPVGYLLSRRNFRGKALVESILDIPIFLPPMVIGLCLLIFFQTPAGALIEKAIPFTYTVFGVVMAQVMIAAAFSIRTMRGTFDHMSPRPEEVAMTLGCSRGGAVCRVTLPAASKGMVAAVTVAWARSLGEFGPILVFAGATRLKTEVLPTTVWLEMSVGNLEGAVAVSLLMVICAIVVLVFFRWAGERGS
jgi:molybdate transport system permease protein